VSHIHLLCTDNIPTSVGVHMRYNKPKHEFPMHDHEFHEIVLVVNGHANHYINGSIVPMNTGDLYFIRNTDIHTYSDFVGDTFEYYTLLLDTSITDELFAFLGKGFLSESLFTSPMPPTLHPDKVEKEALDAKFSTLFLMLNGDEDRFLTETKLLITDIFAKYHADSVTAKNNIPLWLEYAREKMNLPKNFTQGTERFYEICGRSREHCTRMMKKHYGISPNTYVSELRLKYAANLLTSGDLTVSETAIECGYASIPHFYGLFTKRFGLSPKEYRDRTKNKI